MTIIHKQSFAAYVEGCQGSVNDYGGGISGWSRIPKQASARLCVKDAKGFREVLCVVKTKGNPVEASLGRVTFDREKACPM